MRDPAQPDSLPAAALPSCPRTAMPSQLVTRPARPALTSACSGSEVLKAAAVVYSAPAYMQQQGCSGRVQAGRDGQVGDGRGHLA